MCLCGAPLTPQTAPKPQPVSLPKAGSQARGLPYLQGALDTLASQSTDGKEWVNTYINMPWPT